MSWREYNPFAEREPPPMSAPMFTTLVVARLRTVPGLEILSQKELELSLRVRGQPRTKRLESAYQQYRADPAALTPIVQRVIQSVSAGGEPERVDEDQFSFASIAPNLLPLLMTSTDWSHKRETGLRVVIRPLVQDLGIALVVDEEDAITYVELDAIPRWGVDAEYAYETANRNLEALTRSSTFTQVGEGDEVLLIDRTADGYAASRVLLPSRLEDWSRRVMGDLVLGLPHRDLLIGFGADHPNLEALRARVKEDAESTRTDRALLPHLLTYRGGTLEIYD